MDSLGLEITQGGETSVETNDGIVDNNGKRANWNSVVEPSESSPLERISPRSTSSVTFEDGDVIQLDLRLRKEIFRLLPVIFQWKAVQELNLSTLSYLDDLPSEIDESLSTSLLRLNLSRTQLFALPVPYCFKLSNLEHLNLSQCQWLRSLPPEIERLESLVALDVSECKSLCTLPSATGKLKRLEVLNVSACINLTSFAFPLEELSSLKELNMSGLNKRIFDVAKYLSNDCLLKDCNYLEVLSLQCNFIETDGLRKLYPAFRACPRLRHVSLACNGISFIPSIGILNCCGIAKNEMNVEISRIQELDFSNNPVMHFGLDAAESGLPEIGLFQSSTLADDNHNPTSVEHFLLSTYICPWLGLLSVHPMLGHLGWKSWIHCRQCQFWMDVNRNGRILLMQECNKSRNDVHVPLGLWAPLLARVAKGCQGVATRSFSVVYYLLRNGPVLLRGS